MEMKTKEIVERLRNFSVPELCDGTGLYDTMDAEIKPMVTTKKIVGPAFTVKVPVSEGAIVTNALEAIAEGEILVIAGHGNCKSSYWGDHRSCCAVFQKAEGVVIDGAFRDIEECNKIGFPIYARGVTPGTAAKAGTGKLNVPVSCGGVVVEPGDIIVGDATGVCVVKEEEADEIMSRALRKREAQEWTITEMNRRQKVLPRVIYNQEREKEGGENNDSTDR